VPRRRAVKLIRPRSRQDLNLSVATAHFRVHGRQDHADFPDKVRVHFRRRFEPVRPPLVVHADAVTLDVHIAGADPGEACLLRPEDFVIRQKGPAHDGDQIQHVVAHERQIPDLFFGQNLAYGRRGCCDEVLRCNRDFNCLRGRGYL